MRVVLASQEYPPETAHGGIASQTRAKARGLARRGHDVVVVSRSVDGERRETIDGGARIVRIAGTEGRGTAQTEVSDWVTYSGEVAAEVARLQREAPVDVADFPEWGCEAFVHLLNKGAWDTTRTAIQLHGPIVMLADELGWPDKASTHYQIGTALERACLELADGIFSSSDCSARSVAEHYGIDVTAVPVLHLGVDTARFAPARRRPERPTVVFVGRIARAKGVEDLLEACLELAADHPDLRLRIIGRNEGRLADGIVERATAAGFPRLVDVVGPVGHDELPTLLGDATIFAAPSWFEGGPGLVYLEAMACGLPVVACDAGGAAEVVHHEENGLQVPRQDVEALIKAIDRLLRDDDERTAMGHRARARVEVEASREVCLRRLESLYTDLIERRPWRR